MNTHESFLEKNALVYVAGYVLKKCMSKHACQVCSMLFTKSFDNSSQTLCFFKCFDQKFNDFGAIAVPVSPFVNYIEELEKTTLALFQQIAAAVGVGKSLLRELVKIPFQACACAHFPKIFLIKLFIRMRLHYILKFNNREMKMTTKSCKKFLKITHL